MKCVKNIKKRKVKYRIYKKQIKVFVMFIGILLVFWIFLRTIAFRYIANLCKE